MVERRGQRIQFLEGDVREDESSSALVETFSLYKLGHFLMEAYAYWHQLDRNAVMQLLHQKFKKKKTKKMV